MIDLKQLRDDPERFRQGCADKGVSVDLDRLLALDHERRGILTRLEEARAAQNKLGKETGPQMGRLKGQLKSAEGDAKAAIEAELAKLERRPSELKASIHALETELAAIEPAWRDLWMQVPQPPAPDVPPGKGSEDNVEIRRWSPAGFDPARSFAENRGFAAKTHLELVRDLGLVDFERGVKMAGSRHYVLTGLGMRLHQAVLRWAFDFMTIEQGFTPLSVPVIVREECMTGTGFFP